MDVHYSSKTPEWETPDSFFNKLDEEFGFNLDVCATPENAKCENYFTKYDNGLVQIWEGVCWCNPPYGREISKWVEKAYYTSTATDATIVCLLPARTDTAWWHNFVMRAGEIRFVRGRLKFGGHKNPAPFPNAAVVFGPEGPPKFSSMER